jgi:hypothetical protein
MSTTTKTISSNPKIAELRKQKIAIEKQEQSILKKEKERSLKQIIKLIKTVGITFEEILLEMEKPVPEKKPRKTSEKRSTSTK